MDRAQKEQVLGEIKEAWQNVASIIIADYAGITVPVVTQMRDDFRKAGCHYRVLKNSLVKIAVKGSKMEPISELMTGTKRLCMAGFGVGLTWASLIMPVGPLGFCEMIDYQEVG